MKPIIQENFADNGAHSHYSVIDSKTGEIIMADINNKLEINEPEKKVGLYKEPNQLLNIAESKEGKDKIVFENITDENFPVEIMRLDKDGMIYKGKRIEDAGEAHRLFLEVLELMKKNYV